MRNLALELGLINEDQLTSMNDFDKNKAVLDEAYERDCVGDLWIKIQGCEACSPERAGRCCGVRPGAENESGCVHRTSRGCELHYERGQYKAKPFRCCITPIPISCKRDCALVYECIQGPRAGRRRFVTDNRDVLR